ncbi:MAG TPA: BTAD domain-containing putative transcriptional regulator [Actinomycetota bacterium]|nr:BTAD domain-containing putative transcriptional regulator [Actinomycetota bacterium]
MTREQLAQLLFAEAADPLGAVRWNIAEIRRLLGDPEALRGDAIRLELPAGAVVDVSVLTLGTWHEALQMPGLGQDLLAGMSFSSSPAFEAWLLSERLHLQSATEAVLREAAHARLAAGEWETAVSLATRLLALNPFSDASQALLIRGLAAKGDLPAAMRQQASCVELFRRELGVEPGPDVMHALDDSRQTITVPAPTRRAAIAAQIEAGEAAVHAGAIEAGLVCLRRAIAESQEAAEDELQARALLAFGSALVHAARGRHEEATTTLQCCILIAARAGAATAAAAYGELAWMECNAGRYERAEVAIAHAAEHLGAGASGQAYLRLGLGACRLSQGRYRESTEFTTTALQQSERDGDIEVTVLSLTQLGLGWLLQGDVAGAKKVLEEAVEMCRSARMVKLVPYPESLLAEVHLTTGDLDRAADLFERAFALGCQLADPCWEGLSRRGIGLIAARRGEMERALAALEDAYDRAGRHPDSDQWIVAYILDALCATAIEAGRRPAKAVKDLESLAARTGMREFLVRAYWHRFRMGERAAGEAARLLATEVDNPALHGLVQLAPSPPQLPGGPRLPVP